MKITIEKARDFSPLPGSGNGKFHGYAFANGKRIGTVWRFNDGRYICNEDRDPRRHNRENRPMQFHGKTLAALKMDIADKF